MSQATQENGKLQLQKLSTGDYELVLDAIAELHSFRELAARRIWLLEEIFPRLIPSDWYSYNEVDLRSPGKTLALLRPNSKLFRSLFGRFTKLAHQHPLIVRQLNSRDFSPHKISDFLSRRAFHQLELYQEVYRPLGVEYQIAASVETRRDCISAFALSRRTRDYNERDRAVLERLRRHLVLALQPNPARRPLKGGDALGLTAREYEVARWISEGKSNAAIAVILGISLRTVHKHVEHVFQRLNVESRTAVALRLLGK